MTLLPAVVAILPLRAKSRGALGQGLAVAIGRVVTRNHRRVLIGSALGTIALTALVPTLIINDRFHEYFDETTAFRQAADFQLEHLTGLYDISWSLDASESQGISDPEYLATPCRVHGMAPATATE